MIFKYLHQRRFRKEMEKERELIHYKLEKIRDKAENFVPEEGYTGFSVINGIQDNTNFTDTDASIINTYEDLPEVIDPWTSVIKRRG